jgi:hypothetical protein
MITIKKKEDRIRIAAKMIITGTDLVILKGRVSQGIIYEDPKYC